MEYVRVLWATECAKILLAGVCNSTLFSLETGKLLLGRNRDFFQDAVNAKTFPISPMDPAFFFKHANLTQLCVSPQIQKILTCNRGFRRICRSFNNNKTSLGKHNNGTQTITWSSHRRVCRCPHCSRKRVGFLGQRFLIFKKLGMTVQYSGPAALFQGKT